VVNQELQLWESEEQDDLRLKHELETLASHESGLSNCETILAVERKDLEEARVRVLARELAVDGKGSA
jgi:hypothetical protein